MTKTAPSPRAAVHDALRKNAQFGSGSKNPAFATEGVLAALREASPHVDVEDPDGMAVSCLLMMFWMFEEWDPRVDCGDHDMGVLTFRGVEVWFKIDQTAADTFKVTFMLPHEF